MSDSVDDILGQSVEIGDRIAAAFRNSTKAELRVGTVVDFTERDNKLTVKVAYTVQSAYKGPVVSEVVGALEADLYRFVKIGTP